MHKHEMCLVKHVIWGLSLRYIVFAGYHSDKLFFVLRLPL